MVNHAAALKVALALLGLSIVGYILAPPLYWHLTEALAAISHSSSDVSSSSYSSCPLCVECDCSSHPLFTIPKGLNNASYADCAKDDLEVNVDTEKNYPELLTKHDFVALHHH